MPATTRYHERLLPSVPALLVMLGVLMMFAIAFGAAFSAPLGWAIAVVGTAAIAVVVFATAPVLEVTDEHLRAGRALLPRSVIAGVEALDAEQVRQARGMTADARQYLMLRPIACGTAVRVRLDDPADPHPAWLVTSRHPQRLAAALQ